MSTVPPRVPAPPRHRLGTRLLAGGLATVAAVLLSGCGLRWETDAPTEPRPDAAETARRAAVDEAQELADAATEAAAGAPEPVAAVLALVPPAAATHVDELGGVYDSGIATPTPTPTATATAAPATPADVLTLLGTAASRARADARDAEDAGRARLLAAVAASRAQLAERLAAALGTPAPAVDADPDDAGEAGGGAADGSGSGDGSAASPAPSGPASGDPAATDSPAPTEPAPAAGSDLGRTTLVALALAEDQTGFGFEVAAARLSGDARALARDSARAHRAAATAWATAAGVAGTADDPRRVTYAVGGELTGEAGVPAFCAGLLSDLAAVHADAVLETSAGTADRTAAVDGLREAAVEGLAWGAVPSPLPGLPAQ
ncbi:DUF4439 domain-containing protein [Cellulomonas hominis]|uniref:DUF4439 domain-containing protein n=1 Tax=Cellulomonas hominis TaxID=156981 RepID=UPI001B96FA62|nr:DUF4439 domain-containing protein [Cellulomonas hominis]VTR78719.1 hypothetical protein CHMI_03503 [Cellulomonas hominis]